MKNTASTREISVLSFNERVLQEAEDTSNPLLERLKFLGIFSSNMDEFFKVRVASVQRRIELGKKSMASVLSEINERAQLLEERFRGAYAEVVNALSAEGIRIVDEHQLEGQPLQIRDWVKRYFLESVLPGLVPVLLRPELPFPQLTDGALYFGMLLETSGFPYALLEIPADLFRFVSLPNGHIMYLDDVIRYSLNEIFYIFSYTHISAYEFKISRDAELDIDNDFSEGYVRKMEKVLRQRKGGRPCRFVYDSNMPAELLHLLKKGLKLAASDPCIAGGRYHNMRDLMRFPARRPELAFEGMPPAAHPLLDATRRPMMDVIRERDILLTYPYQSFDHVIRLLREAAIDPEVQEIKVTLYRVADRSQVVNALLNAAHNGKRVSAVVELQARFDEQRNILISEKLREVGATVLYGVPPMKVHSKLLMIRRGTELFCGLSTGNLNEVTGRLYVDSMLFTANKKITKEVASVFEFFEGAAVHRALAPPKFKHLLLSPFNSRKELYRLINAQKAKRDSGYILIKNNHITETGIIKHLLEAARAGVHIDLIIRTTYAVPVHKNIRAISILDRFLEHQRIYQFGRNEEARVYLSSADLMERNLDWRVEAAFPVLDPELRREIMDVLAIQVADTSKARRLDRRQTNKYVFGGRGSRRTQYDTYAYYMQRAEHDPQS